MTITCHCVTNCVWPGDIDADGKVDMADLLKLGWHIGAKGPERNYLNNSAWLGQYADDWKDSDRASGMNLKFADSNGDGVLTETDTQAIYDHFLLHHDLIPEIYGLKADYEFTIIPPSEPLDSGDLAVFEIEIGTAMDPVVNMHGLYFSLNLPPEIYLSESVEIYFDDNSWLSHDAPNLGMHKEPWHGRLDVGFSRASTTSATGAGKILIMTMIVVDDIDGWVPPGVTIPFTITASNIGGMGGDGHIRDMEDSEAMFFYRTPGDRLEDDPLSIDDKLFVFPNPASDLINVHINGKRTIQSVEIYDMTGKLFSVTKVETKQSSIDVSSFGSGNYVMRVVTTDGVVTRKIQIVR